MQYGLSKLPAKAAAARRLDLNGVSRLHFYLNTAWQVLIFTIAEYQRIDPAGSRCTALQAEGR